MRNIKICFMAGMLAVAAAGCGSDDDDCGDGGCPDAGRTDGGDAGPVLYSLTPGESCFTITAIAVGSMDNCQIGVAALADGTVSLPVTYTALTGTVAVGTMGSIGMGEIRNNMGALLRTNMPTDPMMPTCSWTQTDTTQLQMLANNRFTVSVTEVQSAFATQCTGIPVGGMCTSTWTWTMERSTTKLPPTCR